MSDSRALVSVWTVTTDTDFRSDHLKLCYLWYDEILFETIGRFEGDRFFEVLVGHDENCSKVIRSLTDVIIPLQQRVGREALEEPLEIEACGYPRWGKDREHYTYPDPENAAQYAHNCLLHRIEAEYGVAHFNDGYDVEQAEGRARVAVDAIHLWERVNAELPCMLQANGDEALAMGAARQFALGVSSLPKPISLFKKVVPSLAAVPWSTVVRLRQDAGLTSLRRRISGAVEQAASDIEGAKALFDELEMNTIDSLIETGRPHVKTVAIESALSNLPGLPVNPFSVFFGIRDTVATAKRRHDLGWFYLLRDIRKAAQA